MSGTEPNREIYVYRICKNATEDDSKEYSSTEIGLNIRNIKEISDDSWNTPAFVLTVPASQLQTGLNAEWPAGILVRRFFPPRSILKRHKDESMPVVNTVSENAS